jgi:hypothetical protein
MSFFVGKRVVAVRCMSDEEMAEQEWEGCRPTPTVLEFEDGSFIFAAADSTHSAPGVLAGELSTGDSIVLRAKRGKPLTMAAAPVAAACPDPVDSGSPASSTSNPALADATAATVSDQPWRRTGGLTRTAEDAGAVGHKSVVVESLGSFGTPAPEPESEAAAAADAALQALGASDSTLEAASEPEESIAEEETGGGLAGLLSSLHGFLKSDPEATLSNKHFHEVDLDEWNAALAADGKPELQVAKETAVPDDVATMTASTAPTPAAAARATVATDLAPADAEAARPSERSVYVADVGSDTEPELTPEQQDAESQLLVLEQLHADGLLSDSVYEGQRQKLEGLLAGEHNPTVGGGLSSENSSNAGVWPRAQAEPDGESASGQTVQTESEAARQARQAALTQSPAAIAGMAGVAPPLDSSSPPPPPPPPTDSDTESESD